MEYDLRDDIRSGGKQEAVKNTIREKAGDRDREKGKENMNGANEANGDGKGRGIAIHRINGNQEQVAGDGEMQS